MAEQDLTNRGEAGNSPGGRFPARATAPAVALLVLIASACSTVPVPNLPTVTDVSVQTDPQTTADQQPVPGDGAPLPDIDHSMDPLGETEPASAIAQTPLPDNTAELLESADFEFGAEKVELMLAAAERLIENHRIDEAKKVLDRAKSLSGSAQHSIRRDYLLSRIDIESGKYTFASQRLQALARVPNLDNGLREQMLLAAADAEVRQGETVSAAYTLSQFASINPGEHLEAHDQIWDLLLQVDPDTLQQARTEYGDTDFAGWINLALAYQFSTSNRGELRATVSQWRNSYPSHPANLTVVPEITGSLQEPRQIALLLPLASRYGLAAQAVHDGVMAIHLADASPTRPEVILYDIGEEAELAGTYYRLAVQEGADAVIGPLGKEAVEVVASQGDLSVPTILLGNVVGEYNMPRGVFQLTLRPEDEARAVAGHAHRQGHRRAAILYSENDRGLRIRDAFAQRWQQLGGYVSDSLGYVPGNTDFSVTIKQLLNVDDSIARHRTLDAVLGSSTRFTPRRRDDVDFVFLVANARDGRLIVPQIDFFQGLNLPVLSTSDIYAGERNPVLDADLNGVIFSDMPWMVDSVGRAPNLREQIQQNWDSAGTALDRLYALGVDAYSLSTKIYPLTSGELKRFNGITANMELVDNGQLERQFRFSEFDQGIPRPIQSLR